MRCDGEDHAGRNGGPSQAELDALLAVIVATVDLAERTRSEAATVLLRRAMALVRNRGADDAGRNGTAAQDFRAS